VLFLVYYTNKGGLGAVMVVLSEWLRQAFVRPWGMVSSIAGEPIRFSVC